MKKKGNISIKAKLLGIIIPVVIAIILILVFTAYHVSSGIIESYSKNLLESSVNSQASKIEAWLEENLASMQMAKTMIEKLHPDETQLQTILDASCGYSENYPDGLFLADANGSFLKGTDSKKQEPNPKESMWYQEGMTRVNMAVGSAHQNPDGTNVVSASGLLNDGSDTVRVIAADMTLDRISVIVNSFIEMHDAEAFLVDKDSSVILASRDSGLISRTLGADGQSAFYKDVEKKVSGKSYDFCTLDGSKRNQLAAGFLCSYACCTCGSGRIAESYDHFQHYFDPCIVCFDRTCDACGDSTGEGDDKGNYQHGIR